MTEAMTRIHHRKIAICAELETIADCLPANIDHLTCLQVAATLLPTLRLAHDYEETVVFPAYEKAVADSGRALSTDRLRGEHISDACFAADLTGILLDIGHGGAVQQPETLGFMLRGFFDSLRRHVAFEREHVAPLVCDSAFTPPNRSSNERGCPPRCGASARSV
ncbi:hemerythrin domain-containing protein [Pararhizobium sp.]|uniref:hemerythrin domain-containing protein n=1 Tax=Pararhizobium sp. TaxID=1977563 RepID=UPI002D7FD1B2|nr:hemerythrin domain-containing protein [Pararhizobium sp.]